MTETINEQEAAFPHTNYQFTSNSKFQDTLEALHRFEAAKASTEAAISNRASQAFAASIRAPPNAPEPWGSGF